MYAVQFTPLLKRIDASTGPYWVKMTCPPKGPHICYVVIEETHNSTNQTTGMALVCRINGLAHTDHLILNLVMQKWKENACQQMSTASIQVHTSSERLREPGKSMTTFQSIPDKQPT